MAEWYYSNPDAGNYFHWLQQGRDGTTPETAWTLDPSRNQEGRVELELLSPGDTLWLLDYHDWATLNMHLSLTGVHGLTLRGDYPGRAGGLASLSLYTSTDITVTGLKVNRIYCEGASGLFLDGCEIHNASRGIQTNQTFSMDNVTITHCQIHDCTMQGIGAPAWPDKTRDNWNITHNHIWNIGVASSFPDADVEAIGVQRFRNSVIAHNYIHHCDYGINLWEDGQGNVNNVRITDNVIHDIFGGPSVWPSRGIMISGAADVLGCLYDVAIRRNTIYRVGKEGIRATAAPTGAQGLVIADNVIADVNIEWGRRHTEYITYKNDWQLSNNRMYQMWPIIAHPSFKDGNFARSWSA